MQKQSATTTTTAHVMHALSIMAKRLYLVQLAQMHFESMEKGSLTNFLSCGDHWGVVIWSLTRQSMIAIIVNLAIRRICSQSKPWRGRTAETRENGRGRSVRHRSHARVQARFDSAPLPPPPPQISYAHRTYKRLETASFGPNDSDPGARVKLGAVKSE